MRGDGFIWGEADTGIIALQTKSCERTSYQHLEQRCFSWWPSLPYQHN